MTEIEQKALALVNEIAATRGTSWPCVDRANDSRWEALCRLIEQHEAFRQEVSDAAELARAGTVECGHSETWWALEPLDRFILPKPVDPLVEAMRDACGAQGMETKHTPVELTEHLRAALAKRGLQIVDVGQ